MVRLAEIIDYCNRRLNAADFEDYCPNFHEALAAPLIMEDD